MDHLPAALANIVNAISGMIGFAPDKIAMLLCWVVALPLGYVHSKLRSVLVRHLWSIFWGVILGFFMFGTSFFNVLLLVVISYELIVSIENAQMPYIVIFVAMAHLSAIHIYRQAFFFLEDNLDVSQAVMIAVVKITQCAFNIADHRNLKADSKYRIHPKEEIHQELSSKAIPKLSLLEYLSYVLYYGGLTAGPPFEVKYYLQFQDMTLFKETGYPNTLKPTIKKLIKSFLCFPIMFIQTKLPFWNYVYTPAFGNVSNFIVRALYLWIMITMYRFKYYFAWFFSEAGCNIAGLGFDPEHPDDWEMISNVDVFGVELNSSVVGMVNNWNKQTAKWLKYYVYLRVKSVPNSLSFMSLKSFAMIVTRVVSAFWHGFYVGYYIFFVVALLINETEAAFGRIFGSKKSKGMLALQGFVSHFALGTFGASFVFLRARWAWMAWKNTYFLGPILCMLIILVGKSVKKDKRIIAVKKD